MKKVIVVTGASSGFGALAARALAKAGHVVYASMRDTSGRNKGQVQEAAKFAADNKADLRTVELDVLSDTSANAAITKVIEDNGRLDVVVHNAGHMVFGPLEAFTPEQLAELYDVNVLSTQRVNRAALPQLRKQKQGLVVWVSSSSSAGGTPPYLAPYFAAKAGMDALAVVSARELTRWGIETSIVVPGAFTGGTNHFAHSGRPADTQRVAEYDNGPYKSFADDVMKGFCLDCSAGRRCRCGWGSNRQNCGCSIWKASFPCSRRSHAGWSRGCEHGQRPRTCGIVAPNRSRRRSHASATCLAGKNPSHAERCDCS